MLTNAQPALRCLLRKEHELHTALGVGTVVLGSACPPKARMCREGLLALPDFSVMSVIWVIFASVSPSDSLPLVLTQSYFL